MDGITEMMIAKIPFSVVLVAMVVTHAADELKKGEIEGSGSSGSQDRQDPTLAIQLNNAGSLLTDRGDYTQAQSIFERSLLIAERSLGADHPDVAAIQSNLGHLYVLQHRYAKAAALLHHALEVRERVFGSDHPEVASSLKNLGEMYHSQYRYLEAEAVYRRALSILEHEPDPNYPKIAGLLTALAELQSALGYYSSAALLFARSISIVSGLPGPGTPELARNYEGLAAIRAAQNHQREAESLYLQALRLREQRNPDSRTAMVLLRLATLYVRTKRFDAAGTAIGRALSMYERLSTDERVDVKGAFDQYVQLIRTQNRRAEAAIIETRLTRH